MTLQPLKVILLTSPGSLRAQRLPAPSWACTSPGRKQRSRAGQHASNLLVNGQTVEGVQSFIYLGSAINSADCSRSEQLRRIRIAAGNMNNLECIWRQPHLLLATKLHDCKYMTLIVPMLLYASETWTSTKVDLNHLQEFHTHAACTCALVP